MSSETKTTTVESKRSTIKWIGLPALAVLLIGGVWFGINWFADPSLTTTPLKPSDTVIQKEIADLQSEVSNLEAQARDAARKLVANALSDDYLSVQEEKDVPDSCVKEAETIKSLAPYPAVIEGFVFQKESGEKHSVAGFSFDDKKAREILDGEFNNRSTAVRERDLIEQLRGMLRQQTGDKILDDDERNSILRSITTPKAGKKAGLNRGVAASTIDSYCRANGIQTGSSATTVP